LNQAAFWGVFAENTGFAEDADLGGQQPSPVKSLLKLAQDFSKY